MNSKYKPNYDYDVISKSSKRVNISGRSEQDNLSIEEANQRRAAESDVWLLARESYGKKYSDIGDSSAVLSSLGFTILGEADDLFYKVQQPEGWTKETSGYWTTIRDTSGSERILQFFKGAWYDRNAFLTVQESEK